MSKSPLDKPNPAILLALKEVEKYFYIPKFSENDITRNNPALIAALKEQKFYIPIFRKEK